MLDLLVYNVCSGLSVQILTLNIWSEDKFSCLVPTLGVPVSEDLLRRIWRDNFSYFSIKSSFLWVFFRSSLLRGTLMSTHSICLYHEKWRILSQNYHPLLLLNKSSELYTSYGFTRWNSVSEAIPMSIHRSR